MAPPEQHTIRQRVWPYLKWSLFALIVWFVAQRGWELWQADRSEDVRVHWPWLIPAGMAYLAGWLPAVWFWRRMMQRLGQHVGPLNTARAYYCGHLGKYVPGKASVILIRAALLKGRGSRPAIAALTAAYETLTTMATGAAVAVALAPHAIGPTLWRHLPAGLQTLREYPVLLPLAVVGLTIAAVPLVARLFSLLGLRLLPPDMRREDQGLSISTQLLLQGLIVLTFVWMLHAISLGCTLQAVSDTPLAWTSFPVWLASVSIATVLGFMVLFAPGGMGVREFLLIESLHNHPSIGPQQAVLAALLLRAVWFLAEVVAAGALYWISTPPDQPAQEAAA